MSEPTAADEMYRVYREYRVAARKPTYPRDRFNRMMQRATRRFTDAGGRIDGADLERAFRAVCNHR